MLRIAALLFYAGLAGMLAGAAILGTSLWRGSGRSVLWLAAMGAGLAASVTGVGLAAHEKRKYWQPVLTAELVAWQSNSIAAISEKLSDSPFVYQVAGRDGAEYQVEVELIEVAPKRISVGISVDDGTLPGSIFPAGGMFVLEENERIDPS